MKTAMSIPDEVFKKADALARKRKISRSALFTEAVEKLLHEADDAELTRRLHEYYDNEDSSLDPVFAKMQYMSLPPNDWAPGHKDRTPTSGSNAKKKVSPKSNGRIASPRPLRSRVKP